MPYQGINWKAKLKDCSWQQIYSYKKQVVTTNTAEYIHNKKLLKAMSQVCKKKLVHDKLNYECGD